MMLNRNEGPLLLSPSELCEVRRILNELVPEYAVWAFGSRVGGAAKPYSDLDIAIITNEPLSLAIKADLSEAFAESDLVFKVDVVDWASTSGSFRRIVEAGKIVLQTGAALKPSDR